MCLITNGKRMRASKDIICYKVLDTTQMHYGIKLSSPYRGKKYELNVLYKDTTKVTKTNGKAGEVYIYGGYLHTFKTEAAAEFKCIGRSLTLPKYNIFLCQVFKCIIPKGSYYYEGYAGVFPSYASKQLKIIEQVSDYKQNPKTKEVII